MQVGSSTIPGVRGRLTDTRIASTALIAPAALRLPQISPGWTSQASNPGNALCRPGARNWPAAPSLDRIMSAVRCRVPLTMSTSEASQASAKTCRMTRRGSRSAQSLMERRPGRQPSRTTAGAWWQFFLASGSRSPAATGCDPLGPVPGIPPLPRQTCQRRRGRRSPRCQRLDRGDTGN